MALFLVISNGFSLVKYPKEKASNRILTKVLVRKVYDQLWVQTLVHVHVSCKCFFFQLLPLFLSWHFTPLFPELCEAL